METISNFRDVGGCPAAGGNVRTGALYRSASLAELTDAGVAHLTKLGIRTVIDLRRPTEVERYGRVADAAGRRYVNIAPQHTLWDAEPPFEPGTSAARYLADRYVTLAHDGAREFSAAIRLIGTTDAAPVLVHCFAGKDRTGVLIALTLALLGVADDDIAADYARSDEWSRAHTTPDIPAHWLPAPPAAIHLFLAELRRDFGGTDGFAASAGLTAADIAALRSNLVR